MKKKKSKPQYYKFRYNDITTTYILRNPDIHQEGLYSQFACKGTGMAFTKGTGFFPFLNMSFYKRMPESYEPPTPKAKQ